MTKTSATNSLQRPGFQTWGTATSTCRTRSTRLKAICCTCGEPHYHHDYLVERAREAGSARHTTVGDLGKAHQIHAAVKNCQAEYQSTVLETSCSITDHTFSILIDSGATKSFIFCVVLKSIKVKAFK
jgi:pyruvate-formate lyase-activating enzyme